MEISGQVLTQANIEVPPIKPQEAATDIATEMPLQQIEFIPAGEIAEGSYGQVKRCVAITEDDGIEYNPMVQKRIKPIEHDDANEVQAIREDLHNEASLMHMLHSQELQIAAVPTVVQFNENENLVMTLIQGQTLDKFFSMISQDQIIDITYQLLKVLQQMHENAGIIVRDIKPSNIFVLKLFKKEFVLRAIGDLGIAHQIRTQPVGTGERILGSPPYTPPEVYGYSNSVISEFQASASPSETTQEEISDEKESLKPVIGPKTDIFAVGILLEQFLAERHIQPADVGEGGVLNYRLLRQKIVEVLEGLPPDLIPIIERATDFREAQRYESASLMIEALDTLQIEKSFLSCVVTDRLNHESFSENLTQAIEESDQLKEEKLLDISHTISLLLLNPQNRDLVDLPLHYLEEYLTEETLTSDVAEVILQILRYLDTPALGWPDDQQKGQREDIRNRLLDILHTNLRDNYLEGIYAAYLYDTAKIPIPAKLEDIVEEIREENSAEEFIIDEDGKKVPLEVFMQRLLSATKVEQNENTGLAEEEAATPILNTTHQEHSLPEWITEPVLSESSVDSTVVLRDRSPHESQQTQDDYPDLPEWLFGSSQEDINPSQNTTPSRRPRRSRRLPLGEQIHRRWQHPLYEDPVYLTFARNYFNEQNEDFNENNLQARINEFRLVLIPAFAQANPEVFAQHRQNDIYSNPSEDPSYLYMLDLIEQRGREIQISPYDVSRRRERELLMQEIATQELQNYIMSLSPRKQQAYARRNGTINEEYNTLIQAERWNGQNNPLYQQQEIPFEIEQT